MSLPRTCWLLQGSKVLHLSILKGSFQQARRFGVLIPRPLPLTVSLPHAGDGEIENFNERALGKLKKVRDKANVMVCFCR